MALTSFEVKAKVLTVAHKTRTVQPPSPLRPHFLLPSPLLLCSSHTGLLVVPIEDLCLRTFALASPSQECSFPKYSHGSLSLLWSLLKCLLVSSVFPLFKIATTLTHFQSLFQFMFFSLVLTTSSCAIILFVFLIIYFFCLYFQTLRSRNPCAPWPLDPQIFPLSGKQPLPLHLANSFSSFRSLLRHLPFL